METAEKNTFTARIGYDVLPNLNFGASYLNGSVDADQIGDCTAMSDSKMWALDSTWGIIPNLGLEAEYVDYNFDISADEGGPASSDGNMGLIQLKYDITKVPAPLNKLSFVTQYSWDNPEGAANNEKNVQEEVILQAGKNLSIFWQNVQDKFEGQTTDKYYYLALKYNLF